MGQFCNEMTNYEQLKKDYVELNMKFNLLQSECDTMEDRYKREIQEAEKNYLILRKD